MFPPIRLPVPLLAAALFTSSPAPASADWLCIKNETRVPLVVQELPEPPCTKRGKVIRLLPGEAYREYLPGGGERKVQVFDARYPAKPIWAGRLSWSAKGEAVLRLEPAAESVRVSPPPSVVRAGAVAANR